MHGLPQSTWGRQDCKTWILETFRFELPGASRRWASLVGAPRMVINPAWPPRTWRQERQTAVSIWRNARVPIASLWLVPRWRLVYKTTPISLRATRSIRDTRRTRDGRRGRSLWARMLPMHDSGGCRGDLGPKTLRCLRPQAAARGGLCQLVLQPDRGVADGVPRSRHLDACIERHSEGRWRARSRRYASPRRPSTGTADCRGLLPDSAEFCTGNLVGYSFAAIYLLDEEVNARTSRRPEPACPTIRTFPEHHPSSKSTPRAVLGR